MVPAGTTYCFRWSPEGPIFRFRQNRKNGPPRDRFWDFDPNHENGPSRVVFHFFGHETKISFYFCLYLDFGHNLENGPVKDHF